MIIAIDGPSGCGKTSTAKLLSKKLGINYCDSGILYRSITFYLISQKINLDDLAAVKKEVLSIEIEYDILRNRVFINRKNVTEFTRLPKVTVSVSKVSSMKIVRDKLINIQRDLINSGDIVIDGRDIGTTVFPNADYKFYLDATLKIRAKRRFNQLKNKKVEIDYKTVLQMIKDRDDFDRSRVNSPLCKAADALLLDTTNLTLESQVNKIIAIIVNTNKNEVR
ncbi:MAG: cytidylate kinase [Candidatus Marinimicrobia bacterium]|nr:cytidylate kinase [Candidatus Neomarinimicrobiota bacterium]|tara:strand:+ start:2930 stop:3598 length:669 start_codon:yes stop_codon:yes gene_type:complete